MKNQSKNELFELQESLYIRTSNDQLKPFEIENEKRLIPINNREFYGYVLYSLAMIFHSITIFESKFIKLTEYTGVFDINSFILYRSIAQVLLGIYLSRIHNIRILTINEIKHKGWFFVRTFINYISIFSILFLFINSTINYISVLKATIPFVVLLFSILILKEVFKIRYFIGLIICLAGSIVIIFGSKIIEPSLSDKTEDLNSSLIIDQAFSYFLIQILVILIAIISNSLITISCKIIAVENYPIEVQSYYIGLSNIILSIIYAMIFKGVSTNLLFIILSALNGILFYITCYLINESLKLLELSKTVTIQYISNILILTFECIFLNELYTLSYFIGSFIIIAYNGYNAYFIYSQKNN